MSDENAMDDTRVSTGTEEEATSEMRSDAAPSEVEDPARRNARDDANAILEAAAREAERRVHEADGVAQRLLAVAARERDRTVVEARAIVERLDQQRRAILEQITSLDHALGALKATIEASPLDARNELGRDREDLPEKTEPR